MLFWYDKSIVCLQRTAFEMQAYLLCTINTDYLIETQLRPPPDGLPYPVEHVERLADGPS